MSLRDWERNGWLTEHRTSPAEIADLLALANRDLGDSGVEGLGTDWRFQIAYSAALHVATAALAASGFRASREQHHYRVIQSLRESVGLDATLVQTLDGFRRKRNLTGYERAGIVSDAEARAMQELAQQIRREVLAWLREHHAALLPT